MKFCCVTINPFIWICWLWMNFSSWNTLWKKLSVQHRCNQVEIKLWLMQFVTSYLDSPQCVSFRLLSHDSTCDMIQLLWPCCDMIRALGTGGSPLDVHCFSMNLSYEEGNLLSGELGGGNKKEVLVSPLYQHKCWTRQFSCSQENRPGQWNISIILYRMTHESFKYCHFMNNQDFSSQGRWEVSSACAAQPGPSCYWKEPLTVPRWSGSTLQNNGWRHVLRNIVH
jgi:hypothetical protein